jgi:hypothetical protein
MSHNTDNLVLPRFRIVRERHALPERHTGSFSEAKAYWQEQTDDYTLKGDQFCNGDSFAMEMRCKYGEAFVSNHWSPKGFKGPTADDRVKKTDKKRFEDYLAYMRIGILMNAEEDGPKPQPTASSKKPCITKVKYWGISLERGPEKS